MADQERMITKDVADHLGYGQTIYDNAGKKVGTVDDVDRVAGWLKAEINPFSDRALYIPLKLITTIDPQKLSVSRSKNELRRDYANPPARTTSVEKVFRESRATTREASGYDGSPVVVDEVDLNKLRKRIGEGYAVVTADMVDLGTIKRYDRATGWMLIRRKFGAKNDLLVPVTVASHVNDQFGVVHLAVSSRDLRSMQHLEPVDVVLADIKADRPLSESPKSM